MARSPVPRCVEGRFWVRWGAGVGGVQAAAVAVGVSQGNRRDVGTPAWWGET